MFEPSIQSSLKFLRRTDWARRKVEALYLNDQKTIGKTEDRKTSGSTEVRDSADSPTID